jgi:hypothetical protein
MSDDDRRVTRRSNRECRDIADRTKLYYGNKRRWPVDIRKILKSGKIQTLYGERPLIPTALIIDCCPCSGGD